uniref:Peroxisomal biogenesis factor 19 n=1 Tax=Nothoprocta perdicaria TaxID=30464 RepID=A0A8C6YXX7_NOTPE
MLLAVTPAGAAPAVAEPQAARGHTVAVPAPGAAPAHVGGLWDLRALGTLRGSSQRPGPAGLSLQGQGNPRGEKRSAVEGGAVSPAEPPDRIPRPRRQRQRVPAGVHVVPQGDAQRPGQERRRAAGRAGAGAVREPRRPRRPTPRLPAQSSGVSEEELAKAIEGLGLEEGDGEGSIVPLMQNIMQNLLSKEVLYPSLKEITEKYPEWLQLHRGRLSPEQYDKYREQHSVMGKICEQFEAERPTDGEAEHRARFEAVLDLMQQLQDLGHPPKELAGESPPGLNVDLEGLSLPDAATAAGEQCRLM